MSVPLGQPRTSLKLARSGRTADLKCDYDGEQEKGEQSNLHVADDPKRMSETLREVCAGGDDKVWNLLECDVWCYLSTYARTAACSGTRHFRVLLAELMLAKLDRGQTRRIRKVDASRRKVTL